LPDGWEIARRQGHYWLQRQGADGAWHDVAGPYTRYHSAVERANRIIAREQRAEGSTT
jgi:hypothetical protein